MLVILTSAIDIRESHQYYLLHTNMFKQPQAELSQKK